LGFVAYVEAVTAAAPDGRLFPGLTSGNYSACFNALRYEVAMAGKKNFHSFRHGFKTAARRCRVEDQYSDALTGHRNGSVGRIRRIVWPLLERAA
jgi:integrase